MKEKIKHAKTNKIECVTSRHTLHEALRNPFILNERTQAATQTHMEERKPTRKGNHTGKR